MCGGLLKPDVVYFGEDAPDKKFLITGIAASAHAALASSAWFIASHAPRKLVLATPPGNAMLVYGSRSGNAGATARIAGRCGSGPVAGRIQAHVIVATRG